ncbi:MAG TPA: hypothetical protein VLA90_05380 [Actinomycetota bacterium]|nr:hypothetical protein [Actinomycetota bacterium]
MGSREERLAQNEVISREINEGIEDAKRSISDEGYARMVCECGYADCARVVAITVEEYERVRQDARQFVVVNEHVMPEIEEVLSQFDRFTVVRKRDGTPAEVAEKTDPRD